MTAGLEGLAVAQWVYATLSTDPILVGLLGGPTVAPRRITEGILPDDEPLVGATGQPLPWVTFTIVEPQDVRAVGLIQVMTMVEFQVRVTTLGASYGPAEPVYARVHALLDGKANQAVSRGLIDTCERITGQVYPERTNGQDFRHVGGLYRTYVE